MFAFTGVTLLFSAIVFSKEWIAFTLPFVRSCRRQKRDAVEIHTNSIEGLWLAAYLAKKQMATNIHVVEYESAWQTPYFVGEDISETERALLHALDSDEAEIEWKKSQQPIKAEVRCEDGETFVVDLTSKKSFLFDVMDHYEDKVSVAVLQWMQQLEKTDADFDPVVKADYDFPICLKDMSYITTRRYFSEQWEPKEGWTALEDRFRTMLTDRVVFAPSHATLTTTVDIRIPADEPRGTVDWSHEVTPISPNLPYEVAMDLAGVTKLEKTCSSPHQILSIF
jgi:hypothetical protein